MKVTAGELFVGTWTISSAKFSCVKNTFGIEIFVPLIKSSRSVSSLIVFTNDYNDDVFTPLKLASMLAPAQDREIRARLAS